MGVDLLIPRNRNDDAGARIGFVEIISVSLLASCRCYLEGSQKSSWKCTRKFLFTPPPLQKRN